MKICGIELKASDAILVVIKVDGDNFNHLNLETKKIPLGNGECNIQVASFKETIDSFIRDNEIEKIFIKKRGKTGKFAGGPNTFKMEGLIQISSISEVKLISAQTISAMQKRNNIELPDTLNIYQNDAYLTGITGMQ